MRTWLRDLRSARHFVALISALVLALVVAACGGETAGPEEGADVEDIQQDEAEVPEEQAFDQRAFFEDPASFVGQQVTVSAEVTEVISDSAFRLTGDDVGATPLLVMRANQQTAVEEGQVVEVTGTVREFDLQTVEDEFGVDLADEEFVNDRVYIEATNVTVIESGDPDIEASPEVTETE